MRLALFSDIHSNLEALETATLHAKSQGIQSFAVLGDTVGYGASPNECFEWALQHASFYLMGNHENAVVDPRLREWFNPVAREAIVWTEEVMKDTFKKEISGLPYLRHEKGFVFAHGSPDHPEGFRYLINFQDALASFRQFQTPVCFVGHTHIPSCFCEQARTARYLAPGILTLEPTERYILNPGSVGQPRDRDPRLSYGVFDDQAKTFEIIRLPYPNEKAASKIRKAGLPASLADRLL